MHKEETEISYQHPWLGRLYYRGVAVDEIINSELSLLEAAYFLIKGRFLEHDKILTALKSSYEDEDNAIKQMKKLMNRLLTFLEEDEKTILDIILEKKKPTIRSLLNIMIIYLDNERDLDTYHVIKNTIEGGDIVNIIFKSYKLFNKKITQKITIPYKIVTSEGNLENIIDDPSLTDNLGDRKYHYLILIRDIVLKEATTDFLKNKLQRLTLTEKMIRNRFGKYLNIDLYTPLLLEKYGYLNRLSKILYIPRSLGLLAYAIEAKRYSSTPDNLVYKGPIGIKPDFI